MRQHQDPLSRRDLFRQGAETLLSLGLGASLLAQLEGKAAESVAHPLEAALEKLSKLCPGFIFKVESAPKPGQPVILQIPESLAQVIGNDPRDLAVQTELEKLITALGEGNSRLVLTRDWSLPRAASNEWSSFTVHLMRGKSSEAERLVEKWGKNSRDALKFSHQERHFWHVQWQRGRAVLGLSTDELSPEELLRNLGAVGKQLAGHNVVGGNIRQEVKAAGLNRAIKQREAEREQLIEESPLTLDPLRVINERQQKLVYKLEAETPEKLVASIKGRAKKQQEIFEKAYYERKDELTKEQLAHLQPSLFVTVFVDLKDLKKAAAAAGVGLVTVERKM